MMNTDLLLVESMEEGKETEAEIRQRPLLSPAIYMATADILHGKQRANAA
jgi:hypothetical protein